MLKLSGMWKPKKEGAKYTMSGFFDLDVSIIVPRGARFVVLPNKERRNPNSPAWNLFLSVDTDQDKAGQEVEEPEEPPIQEGDQGDQGDHTQEGESIPYD